MNRAVLMLASAAAGAVGSRLLASRRLRLVRMGGTTIAAPGAAGWATDFLNAAYYRRPRDHRDLDSLRLAFDVLTTRWYQLGRRLAGRDVLAFHRAFARERLTALEGEPRGTLDHEQLMEGAARLLGDWFPDARADPDRRGWGIVFPTAADKAGYRPERRLADARLGGITPPTAPPEARTWHTYRPVAVDDPKAVLAVLSSPERWPEFGSELGRFVPVQAGGLANQTFEIEVVGEPLGPAPMLLRGYVTATLVCTGTEPEGLRHYTERLAADMARYGPHEPTPVPEAARPLAAIELTTHEGHFMGKARNRLLLYEEEGQAWLRAVGTWDPFDRQRELLYWSVGRHAQHAFWGMGKPSESLLHQIAEVAAAGDAPGARA